MELASRVEVVETTHRGHATELAANHADQVDRVIAVGGDGTLNEVLCGLMSTGREADHLPELGFLPSGTANAAVLPVPVWAQPSTSRPPRAEGIVRAWIGVGVS